MLARIRSIFFVLSIATLSTAQQYLCPTCQPCVTCQPQRDPPPVSWAAWGEWGPCTNSGGYTAQTRVRGCSALACDTGLSTEARACTIARDPTPPPPQWSSWSAFGQCSVSCGGGIQQRQRSCVLSVCSSCTCAGPSVEQQPCSTQACCTWTAWSPWSECSATCGSGGYRSRTRQCSCYTGCTGPTSEQETCSAAAACPALPTPAPPTQCDTCQPVVVQPCYTCYNPCVTCGYYGRKKRAAAAAQLRGVGPAHLPSSAQNSAHLPSSGKHPTVVQRQRRALGFIPQ